MNYDNELKLKVHGGFILTHEGDDLSRQRLRHINNGCPAFEDKHSEINTIVDLAVAHNWKVVIKR